MRYFTTLLSFTINFIFTKSDKALLFDIYQNLLVEQKSDIHSDETEIVCQNCAIACPAFILDEMNYDDENSITSTETNNGKENPLGKWVLLIEKNYDIFENMNKIELPECKEYIEPSVGINKISGILETGYQIYDSNNIVDHSYFKNEKDPFLSLYPPNFSENTDPKQVLINYFKSDKKILPVGESIQGFIWIPILSIYLNIDTMSPTRIEYNTDLGIHQSRSDCQQFNVGEGFYEEDTHRSSYSDANQQLLFTGKNESTATRSKNESVCGQKYGCFIQHQIIPSYYMHSSYGALALCTHMNTVPIWEGIVERIRMVDRYLYAMTQIWGSNIHIISGVSGIFNPLKKHFEEMPTTDKELYLDQKNTNIPVPMIFYKVVDYKFKIPPSRGGWVHYFAVVVIHNDPTQNAPDHRICRDWNTVMGWEDIENTELSSGLTYVCDLSRDVASKLNLSGIVNLKIPLRLHDMSHYDVELDDYVHQDERHNIRDKIKELFGEEGNY